MDLLTKPTVDIDKAYSGITNAETGSYSNPYIRTVAKNTAGGSTAFGPAQITQTLAQEALNKGWLSPDSKKFYNNTLQPMYTQMKYNGNNQGKVQGYNADYDYGGNAGFDPSKHAQDYEMFAKDIMTGLSNRAGGNEHNFVQLWRGKSAAQDPDYYHRYIQGKNDR